MNAPERSSRALEVMHSPNRGLQSVSNTTPDPTGTCLLAASRFPAPMSITRSVSDNSSFFCNSPELATAPYTRSFPVSIRTFCPRYIRGVIPPTLAARRKPFSVWSVTISPISSMWPASKILKLLSGFSMPVTLPFTSRLTSSAKPSIYAAAVFWIFVSLPDTPWQESSR